MTGKIEFKILEILKESKELNALEISNEISLTYDTIAKYLKRMTEEGKINRKAKGRPWYYFYSLPQERSKEIIKRKSLTLF